MTRFWTTLHRLAASLRTVFAPLTITVERHFVGSRPATPAEAEAMTRLFDNFSRDMTNLFAEVERTEAARRRERT